MKPEDYIVIPEGWTYFAHRSNTERWKYDPSKEETITVEKLMSVVTEREIHGEVAAYGKSHNRGYTSGNGTPFEIRCLIGTMPYVRSLDDDNPLKEIMTKQFYFDRNNFGGCYGQRHHSIPSKEELVVIGIGDHDEVFDRESLIIWTIPRRFIDQYRKDIKNGNNRLIGLHKEEKKEEVSRTIK